MIRSVADLRSYLRADCARHGADGWRPHYRLTKRRLYFQWLLRRSEYWFNVRRDPLGRIVWFVLAVRLRFLGERLGFSISRNTIGPGLLLAHHGLIVINEQASIGAQATIAQGVTIGADDLDRSPTIGDGVHISPNACVIGNVHIGDNVGIWANAVVTKDVPSNCSVAGVPARIVKAQHHNAQ